MTDSFVNLHVASAHSTHWGASPISELVDTAARMGQDSLAITDRDSFAGAVEFARAARDAGIKPIIGCELTEPKTSPHRPEDTGRSVVILARSLDGYRLISRMITSRHLDDDYDFVESLRKVDESVFLLVTDPLLLAELAESIPPAILHGEIIASEEKSFLNRNYKLQREAECLGLKTVLTGAAYGARCENHESHKILRAIGLLSTINRLKPTEYLPSDCHLKAGSELIRWKDRFGDAVEHARELAEQCDFAPSFERWISPEYPPPPGMTDHEYLARIAHDGLRRRIKKPSIEYQRRLQYELSIIRQLGFSSYFLAVWEIVRAANESGIQTVGRGSAANSLVSFCLNLTHVDPIKYDLYFERFLNPGRNSPPDIDIDFSWKRRDEIIDWVYERHGHDRVAMISTHITFRMRSALREVAKALGIPENEINPVTSEIPWGWDGDMKTLRENYYNADRMSALQAGIWPEVRRIAAKIQGFPQHLSIHCGGIVITPDPITNHVPLQRSGFSGKGLAVTQFEMHSIEKCGLIKIDLLGNRSLGVYTDLLDFLKRSGQHVDIENFDMVFADEKTKSLIRSGETMGCFYIESPAMRNLLKRLRVDDFEGLTAASSVIRPGVAESGMMDEFITRHNNPSKTKYLHPKMEELLSRTYGVMIYQEDVIKVAHHIAGLSLADADLLRRAMSGKGGGRRTMEELEIEFIRSCTKRGIEEQIASEIWRQIASFAGYSFCKGHSASFAMLSFQMAYLKTHFPAEFMAGVMSNFGGFYGFGAYMQEARRLGVKILPPDINESEYLHIGSDGAIRLGFCIVKDLETRAVETITDERARNGRFMSLCNFMRRTGTTPAQMKILIECGACDSLGVPRPMLLMQSEIRTPTVREGTISSSSTIDLFPDYDPSPIATTLSDYPPEKLLELELRHFGRLISRHPLELYRDEARRLKAVPSSRMHRYKGKTVTMVGWMIAHKTIRTRRTGSLMKFLSMEDLDGTFEVTMFPECYSRHGWKTDSHGPYAIRGRIDVQFGVASIECEDIEELEGKKCLEMSSPPAAV